MSLFRSHLKNKERVSLSAKQSVDALLGLLGFDSNTYAVFDIWDRETRGLVRGCEAVGIQGRKLRVQVPSTVHRQELIYAKERIIARVNQAMGRKAIIDIQFDLVKE